MINNETVPFSFKYLLIAFFLFTFLLFCFSYLSDSEEHVETALFPEVRAWDLKSLTITDNNNNVLHFRRKNCVWTYGKEAQATNEAQVSELAEQIIALKYVQQIPAQKEMFANLKVTPDSFNYLVEVGLPEGRVKKLLFGSNKISKTTYVRNVESENVFVLSDKNSFNNIPMEKEYWLLENDT